LGLATAMGRGLNKGGLLGWKQYVEGDETKWPKKNSLPSWQSGDTQIFMAWTWKPSSNQRIVTIVKGYKITEQKVLGNRLDIALVVPIVPIVWSHFVVFNLTKWPHINQLIGSKIMECPADIDTMLFFILLLLGRTYQTVHIFFILVGMLLLLLFIIFVGLLLLL
jgi:hypothetical protein